MKLSLGVDTIKSSWYCCVRFFYRKKREYVSLFRLYCKKSKKKYIEYKKKYAHIVRYFFRLFFIYGIYGILLSVLVSGFGYKIDLKLIFALGIVAYILKVELPSIIRDTKT